LEPAGLAGSPDPTLENQADPTDLLGGVVAPASRGAAAPASPVRRAETRERQVPVSMYRLLDSSLVVTVLVVAFILRNVGRMPRGLDDFLAIRVSVKNVLLLVGFTVAWRGICSLLGLYDFRRIASWRSEAQRVTAACALAAAAALPFPLTSVSEAFDYVALALFWAGITVGLLALRRILRLVARVRRKPRRSVLIVGTGPRAMRIKESLLVDPEVDYRVLGFVDSSAPTDGGTVRQPVIAGLEDFDATVMHSPVDEVIVALPMKSQYAQIQHIVEFCESIGVPVTLPADPVPASRSVFRPRESSDSMPAVTLADTPDRTRLFVKRVFDLLGASLALLVLGPLMAVTALMIKLTSRGPVLFTQQRYGHNRRIFRMYKFRTMVVNAEQLQASLEHLNEATGPLFKISHDPRLTVIGRFLRRSSIDELPQLFNVLRGEMSLVGPRPMAIRDVYLFPEATLMRRFSVQAGMTGLWQVRGRNNLSYDEWAAYDLRYVDHWSILGDLKILAMTIPAVMRGIGAH
jgi:exopolysaccharide biosynthesis polyprenyl glycosylphosphotransferase